MQPALRFGFGPLRRPSGLSSARRAITLVVGLALAACGPRGSGSLDLDEMNVQYAIIDDGTTVVAKAKFRAHHANGEGVVLDSGDSVSCDGVELHADSYDLERIYYATVPRGQAVHAFAFRRGDSEPLRHAVPAPADLSITSGAMDGTFASKFRVTWSPANAGGDVTVRLAPRSMNPSVDCLGAPPELTPSPEDAEELVIDGASFRRPKSGAPLDCEYAVNLSRTKEEPLAGGFQGGALRATHTATTTLHFHP